MLRLTPTHPCRGQPPSSQAGQFLGLFPSTRHLREGPLRPSAQALLGGLELSHTCPNASAYTDAPLQGTAPQLIGRAILGSVPSHTVPTLYYILVSFYYILVVFYYILAVLYYILVKNWFCQL